MNTTCVTITGSVADSTGKAMPGVKIHLCEGNDGFALTDPITFTNHDGVFALAYAFNAGETSHAFVVRQELPQGYSQTLPANGFGQHVTVNASVAQYPLGAFVNVASNPAPSPQPQPAAPAVPVVGPTANPIAAPVAILASPVSIAWSIGGNVGAPPKSDPLGIIALKKFGMSRVRLWQYGQFDQPFPAQLLKDIAAYRADGISAVLTYNFQNSTPRLSHPSPTIETAYLNQLPPASEIGQLICEWGNEIDGAGYYTGGAQAYAAGFSIFADIMHAKGHLACVGNMTSFNDAMALGNPASNSIYMQLAKAGVLTNADRAGGHYYTSDHASSLRAHTATAAWLKSVNPAIVYHSTEINFHNAGAAWAAELGLLISGLEAAGLGGDLFPLYPTGTEASAGSLLDASGNSTACGTAFQGAIA